MDVRCATCQREFHSEDDVLKNGSRFRFCSQGHFWFECSCRSCLMVEKKDRVNFSPSMLLSDRSEGVFQKLEKLQNIPLIPTSTNLILQTLSDENASLAKIETALKNNPSLVIRVLSMANQMNSQHKISQLGHAITYVGRDMVKDLVIAATINDFSLQCKVYSIEIFWKEALVSGLCAEILVDRYLKSVNREEAYLAATMCNIGKLVAGICFGDKCDRVYEKSQDILKDKNWTQAEKEEELFEHTVLGEIGCAIWGFPEYIAQAAIAHHTPPDNVKIVSSGSMFFLDDDEPIATDNSIEIKPRDVAALSNQITHMVLGQPTRADEGLLNQYLEYCGLNEEQLGVVLEETSKAYQKLHP